MLRLCSGAPLSSSHCNTHASLVHVNGRLAAAVTDPLKQGQYNTLIKSLQEEQQLLKEMEATVAALQNGGGGGGTPLGGSRTGSAAVVSGC